jgi:broad specificity polyphosphatase/5'/3'-nucleotidase SurE
MHIFDRDEDVDQIALKSGFVSVTPIHFDLTHYQYLEMMRIEWDGKFKLKL